MSGLADDYNSYRYCKFNDALDVLGFTKAQQDSLPPEVRARYLAWTKEGNNNVESDLFGYSDVIPLTPGSKELSFARSAVINWVMYKKRQREGARNTEQAHDDYLSDIQRCKDLLKHLPTNRQAPGLTAATDSLSDVIYPYSQTQGFPPDILY